MTLESSARMNNLAEVCCLHCGRRVGAWEWPVGTSPRGGTFKPGSGAPSSANPGLPHCPECGGPVYLDDVRTVREREQVVWGRAKAGRKRKTPAA